MRRLLAALCAVLGILIPVSSRAEASDYHVLAKRPTSIAIEAPSTLYRGFPQQLRVIATYRDGSTADITSAARWRSGDRRVASMSNTRSRRGQVTPKQTGVTLILARVGKLRARVKVRVVPAGRVELTVTPPNSHMPRSVSQTFTATARFLDHDGATVDVTTVTTWTSNNTSVATLSNAAGTHGRASGVSAGSTTITAAYAGLTASTSLSVTAATLVAITITPYSASTAVGTKKQLIASGLFSDSSEFDLTALATWSSGSGSVASVSNAAGSRGLASGLSCGTSVISATFNAVQGTRTLSVTGC